MFHAVIDEETHFYLNKKKITLVIFLMQLHK